ncbi:MAG TPA: RIP metalloprotease RseP [Steroidobacteraceae bacterium]|nr:RIP metalloprotease RseP [Steroidobacteraceae bacterium]
MMFIWSALWYVVAVGFLVVVHEFGHFWVARRLGFKVVRFSIGFGRPLLRRTIGGEDPCELALAPIPMGGYVKLLDEREGPVPESLRARSFTHRPPWQRILVLLAGPASNVVFAILLLWGMRWVSGIDDVRPIVGQVTAGSIAARAGLARGDEILAIDSRPVPDVRDVVFDLLDPILADGSAQLSVRSTGGKVQTLVFAVPDPGERKRLTEPSMLLEGLGFQFQELPVPPVVGEVVPDGPAGRAGLAAGDRITAINAVPVGDFADVVRLISAIPGQWATLEFQRGGAERTVRLQVGSADEDGHTVGRIGVSRLSTIKYPDSVVRHRNLSPLAALGSAAADAWNLTAVQTRLLYRMLLGQVSVKNLSGPISIAQFAGESADAGASSFLGFLVLISLAIALFNLLPIPLLDGGQIVFQAAEWIKGRPLSERVQLFGQQVGIALLMLLLGVALFNDVSRQFG